MIKAVALSAILGGAVLATTPAQAWWGGPGGWGGPWGGWPGSNSNYMDDWMDGSGWGDMNFSTSMGGRGYGRGYGRDYGYSGYPYGGYPYGGYGGYPYGGYGGYPHGGGWGGPWQAPYMGGPWGYAAPQARPSIEGQNNEQPQQQQQH